MNARLVIAALVGSALGGAAFALGVCAAAVGGRWREVEKVSKTAVDILREYADAIRGNWNIDGRTVKADLEYLADQMTARELTDKEAREMRLCSNICPKGYGFWTGEGYDCDRCDDKECPR